MVVVFVPVRIVSAIGLSMLLTNCGAARLLPYGVLPARAGAAGGRHDRVRLPAQAGHRTGEHVPRPSSASTGPLWFNSPAWAKPSLVLLGLWGIGDLMVIFLAAVLGVPATLYEAASLDGANAWHRFRS
jgi:multiple sugar transport system permease protein